MLINLGIIYFFNIFALIYSIDMSKKIKIPNENIKSRLVDLFHSFMNSRKNHRGSYYDDMDDEELMWLQQQGFVFHDVIDDDYANYYYSGDDDNEIDVIWPPKSRTADDIYSEFWSKESKRNKRCKHKHRKGKKARIIKIDEPYDGEEEYDVNDDEYVSYEEVDDDNGVLDGKEIYYYPDYHDKENRLEFNTLKGFHDFCDDNGYSVPTHILNQIIFNRVSHTCLLPESKENGMYEIFAESSYGNLFYEVCEASELSGE